MSGAISATVVSMTYLLQAACGWDWICSGSGTARGGSAGTPPRTARNHSVGRPCRLTLSGAGGVEMSFTADTRQGKLSVLALSLIHISEPTRRTPISYAVFCLK